MNAGVVKLRHGLKDPLQSLDCDICLRWLGVTTFADTMQNIVTTLYVNSRANTPHIVNIIILSHIHRCTAVRYAMMYPSQQTEQLVPSLTESDLVSLEVWVIITCLC